MLLNINTQVLVPLAEANENFSKVTQLVDESGMAVILKNNKPHYMVLSFGEYDEIQTARNKLFGDVSDRIISQNNEALQILSKF